MKTKEMKRNKGITLIALVITIIILLILAGVTIAMLTGENGILTKAAEARKNTEMAEIKEKAELVKQEMLIDAQKEGSTLKRSDLVEGINTELDGMREGYFSIVEDGKYVVKVDEELNITVGEYTGEYLEEGELGVILTYTPTQSGVEAVKVTVEVKIGGMATYEDYAQEILEDKTQEEKEQYFVEYYRSNMESRYPDYEVNVENILTYYFSGRYESLEDYYTTNGYESLEEYLISSKMVEKDAYPNADITVTLPSGTISNRSLLYPTTTFTVYNNGTYTVQAVYEDQTVEKTIEITNIKDKVIYDLPQEDENTYTISCIEDLVGLSLNVNNCINNYSGKTVKILEDLDFNDDNSYKNPNDTSLGDINNDGKVEAIKTEVTTGEGFTPIGLGSIYDSENQISFSKYFSGNLDGNGKTISNLYIQKTETTTETNEYVGLFGYISSGVEIKNLTLTGDITVNKSLSEQGREYVGSIVAYLYTGDIEGCNSYVNITSATDWRNYTGGIVGYASYNCNISNCNNYGTITGHQIGAIVDPGYVHTGYFTYRGGILGNNGYNGTVQSCNNYGNIEITYEDTMYDVFEGGIVGYNSQSSSRKTASISQCHNYADIEMSSSEDNANRPYVGGICGNNYAGIIEECSNEAQIKNSTKGMFIYSGGICGMSQAGATVRKCYNIGSIVNEGEATYDDASCQAAGIVCSNTGTSEVVIENCYNAGTITNNGTNNLRMGGISSYNSSGSRVRNSYNIGNLVSSKTITNGGAVAATVSSQTVENCYYLQDTYSQGTSSGELGTTVKTETEMQTQEFVELLQGDQTETIWKIVTGQNNGYPVLSWQE